MAGKTKNTSKEQKVDFKIPNQTMIAEIIEQYKSVESINEMIDAILKSDYFSTIKNVNTKDVTAYRKNVNNVLSTFSNMYNIISKMSFENVDFEQIKYYFESFKDITKMVNYIVTSDMFTNLNKINIFDVIEYADIIKEFLEIFDYVAEELYSKKTTLRTGDVKDTVEQLYTCTTSIDPLVNYLIESKKKVKTATIRVRQIYKLINEIIQSTIKFSEGLKKLSTYQDSYKILEKFMNFINGTINKVSDTFENIYKSFIKIFIYAIISSKIAKKANQLQVWDDLREGIIGANRVLKEIAANADIDRLKTAGFSMISSLGENITGKKIGTGSKGEKINFICSAFDSYRIIFFHALWAGYEAKKTNQNKAWTSIKTAINHVNEIMSLITGNSDKDRIKTIGYNMISAVASNATGKNIGTGSKGDKINFILQTFEKFKYIFFWAIVAGKFAKQANQQKTWDSLVAGINGFKRVLSALANGASSDAGMSGGIKGILNDDTGGSEESIFSVIKDRTLGINEIALLEFNTKLLSILPKTFFWAIVAGKFAKKANQQEIWSSLTEGIKGYKKVMLLFNEELLIVSLIVKVFDLNRTKILLEEVILLSLLSVVFKKLLVVSQIAKSLKVESIKDIAIGIVLLLLITGGLMIISFIFKVSSIFLTTLKLIIIMPLVALIFLELHLVALNASGVAPLWKPLLIGLGLLLAVVLAASLISVLISNTSMLFNIIKLNIILVLLGVVFVELIAIGILALAAIIPSVFVLLCIAVLGNIVTQLSIISLLIDATSILTNLVKLNIILALVGVAFVELVALGLLAIAAAISFPFILAGLIVIGLISLAMMLLIVPKSTIKTLLRFDLALLELIVAMGLIIVMDYVLSLISFKRLFFNLFCVIGLFGLISLLFIGALILIPVLMIASITIISILTIVTMLLLIAGALKLLEFIKLKKDDIKANVAVIIDVIKMIVGMFKDEQEDSKAVPLIDEKTWKIDKLLAMMMAAPMLATGFIVIGFMLLISLELLLLSFIKLDRQKIMDNVATILGVVKGILNVLYDKPKKLEHEEGDSAWTKFGKSLFNFGNETFHKLIAISDMLLAIPMMLAAVIVVGLIYLTAKMLKSIGEIDFSDAVITKIHENIDKILECIRYLNNAIKNPYKKYEKLEKKKDDNWFVKGLKSIGNKLFSGVARAKDLIEAIVNTGTLAIAFLNVGMVKLIAENLKTIQDIELNQSLIETRVDDIIRICNTINQKLNTAEFDSIDEDDVELFGDYVGNIGDFIKNINKVNETKTEAFVKVIDKANSIDVDKIKTVRDMFEQMSRFSESVNGNFEKLADVLSEKLVDILEKLHITLQDLKDTTIDVQTSNTGSASKNEYIENNQYFNQVTTKPNYSESIASTQKSAKNNINEQTKKNNEQERMIVQNQQLSQSINNSLSAIQSLLEEFDRRGILLRS